MKVILLHEVADLGKPGDVKEVAPGYARNYLLPRGLVTPATPAALQNLRERVAAEQRRAEKRRAELQALADRIAATNLTFAVRVGRGDRLYGSVTSQDIANALQELQGITIDRRTIQQREPIRQLGTIEVPIRLGSGVEPRVKVTLIPSGTEAALQAQAATGAAGAASTESSAVESSGAEAEPAAATSEA
ncbi:MAG TPA: 50S ribosomal protein L9 [Ktedonobacterales bacterium]